MMTNSQKQWVALELSPQGERENPRDLEKLLRNELGDVDLDIFIPATSFYRRETAMTIYLMEGYAFLEGGQSAAFYLDLERSPYIQKVMTRDENRGRYLVYLPDLEITNLKRQLFEKTIRDFSEGDRVEIIEGAYENLEGVVIDFNVQTENALVKIEELVSLETIVELPLQFLRKV